MLLDEALKDTPTTPAQKTLNLISGVRDTKNRVAPLSAVKIGPVSTDFFGAGEEQLTFDLGEKKADAFDISAPIVPGGPMGGDPLSGALQVGPFDVQRPAEALLETFAPDISDLSRTGLPLSGVDIPDEAAIRETLRKILRRL